MITTKTDVQVNTSREKDLGAGNPEMPIMRYMEGARHDLPIAALPNCLYSCTDTGEAFIYCHPIWNSGPFLMRPKRMM